MQTPITNACENELTETGVIIAPRNVVIATNTWQLSSNATSTCNTSIQVQLDGQILYPTNTIISTNSTGTIYTSSLATTTVSTNYFAYVTGSSVWIDGVLYSQPAPIINWSEIREYARPPIKKSTKNSIKRALKLMCGMGFEEDVKVFLKGDSIEVAHPNSLFKFVITKYDGSLIARTERPGYSTPYRLQLYTKSDIHIANLCVYMEETPILDQVLGVAMFIKSGSEEMILSQANWSCLNNDVELREILALEYPYLKPKLCLPRHVERLQ